VRTGGLNEVMLMIIPFEYFWLGVFCQK